MIISQLVNGEGGNQCLEIWKQKFQRLDAESEDSVGVGSHVVWFDKHSTAPPGSTLIPIDMSVNWEEVLQVWK